MSVRPRAYLSNHLHASKLRQILCACACGHGYGSYIFRRHLIRCVLPVSLMTSYFILWTQHGGETRSDEMRWAEWYERSSGPVHCKETSVDRPIDTAVFTVWWTVLKVVPAARVARRRSTPGRSSEEWLSHWPSSSSASSSWSTVDGVVSPPKPATPTSNRSTRALHRHRRNHAKGRVPSNFGEVGDQVYLVPSDFCDCYFFSLGSMHNFKGTTLFTNPHRNFWI